MRVAEIVNPQLPQSRRRARIAFHALSTFAGPPQGNANTQGQLVRLCRAASAARAGVEQEPQHGDGDRPFRLRAVERPTERGELVVRQVVRLEACLAPPQSLARGLESSRRRPSASAYFIIDDSTASARFAVPARDGQIVEPVAHVLRRHRIDAAIAERGQDVPPHAVRVRIPRRGLPAFGAVGEEHRRGAGAPRWGTPRTRRVTAAGSEVGRVGTVALKRRAGYALRRGLITQGYCTLGAKR
ncbi:MAG: hypothetical protein OXH52_22615 [Gammaproteobacteria bacterium]|nr:hypothetical protein [Gammaproteobacteria bacterium]